MQLATALKYLHQSLTIDQKLDSDPVAIANTRINICAILSKVGRHAQALEQAERAVSVLHSPQAPPPAQVSLIMALYNAGVECEHLGDIEGAIVRYEQGKEAATQGFPSRHHLVVLLSESVAAAHRKRISVPRSSISRGRVLSPRQAELLSDYSKPLPLPPQPPSNLSFYNRASPRPSPKRPGSKRNSVIRRAHALKSIQQANLELKRLPYLQQPPRKKLTPLPDKRSAPRVPSGNTPFLQNSSFNVTLRARPEVFISPQRPALSQRKTQSISHAFKRPPPNFSQKRQVPLTPLLQWVSPATPVDLRPGRRKSQYTGNIKKTPGFSTSTVLEAASSHFTPLKSPKDRTAVLFPTYSPKSPKIKFESSQRFEHKASPPPINERPLSRNNQSSQFKASSIERTKPVSHFKKTRRSKSMRAPPFPPALRSELPVPSPILSSREKHQRMMAQNQQFQSNRRPLAEVLQELGELPRDSHIELKIDNFTVFNQYNTNNTVSPSSEEAVTEQKAVSPRPNPRPPNQPEQSSVLRSPNQETVQKLIEQYRRASISNANESQGKPKTVEKAVQNFNSKIADFSATLNQFERKTREMATHLLNQTPVSGLSESAVLQALHQQRETYSSSPTERNPVDTERSQIDFSELPSALSLESLASHKVEQYELRQEASNIIKEAFMFRKGIRNLKLRWLYSGVPEVIKIQRAFRTFLKRKAQREKGLPSEVERLRASKAKVKKLRVKMKLGGNFGGSRSKGQNPEGDYLGRFLQRIEHRLS